MAARTAAGARKDRGLMQRIGGEEAGKIGHRRFQLSYHRATLLAYKQMLFEMVRCFSRQ